MAGLEGRMVNIGTGGTLGRSKSFPPGQMHASLSVQVPVSASGPRVTRLVLHTSLDGCWRLPISCQLLLAAVRSCQSACQAVRSSGVDCPTVKCKVSAVRGVYLWNCLSCSYSLLFLSAPCFWFKTIRYILRSFCINI